MPLCPFYTDDTQLNILYGFDAEGQARMKHLMMAKRLGSEHLLVDNANAFVREIFETTDFTDVVVVR